MTFSFHLEKFEFRYEMGQAPVLSAIDLQIPKGLIVSVTGLSGSGKSTFISCLGLLRGVQGQTGSIRFADRDRTVELCSLSPGQSDELRRSRFGFALQNSYLLPHLSVLENLVIPLALKGVPPAQRSARGKELLSCMPDLYARRDALVSQISGGQKQRIAVLRALIHEPDVVFADEPFSSLDHQNEELMLQSLLMWHKGEICGTDPADCSSRTLFLVTHDIALAAKVGHCLIHINQGCAGLSKHGGIVESPK